MLPDHNEPLFDSIAPNPDAVQVALSSQIGATFNAVTGCALSRALQSLTNSTSLTISTGLLDWNADRLNSPYLSHQTVNLSLRDDPVPPSLLLISNGAYTVAIGPSLCNIVPTAPPLHSWHAALLPTAPWLAIVNRMSRLVPGLANEARATLMDIEGLPLLTIFILLRDVTGWDADGRPIYAEPATCPPDPA